MQESLCPLPYTYRVALGGHPTEALSNLIKYLSSDDSHSENSNSFPGITPADFSALCNLMDQHCITRRKPRLTYHQGVVIVELLPRPSHEIPVTYIRECITSATGNIPYDRSALNVASYNNLSLGSVKSATHVTPDIALVGVPIVDKPEHHEVFMVKLRLSIEAHPEIQMAMAIFVREEQIYSSPVEGSQAWKALSDLDAMDFKMFLQYLPTSLSHEANRRIIIADHLWCSLEAATFHVWVKHNIDSPIVINASGMASGTLFPIIDIDDVHHLMGEGFLKVKDAIVNYSNMVSPSVDTPSLTTSASTISVDWSVYQRMLGAAVNLTTHERYMDWCHSIANRGKRRLSFGDLDYKDSQEASEVGADEGEVQESPRRSLRLQKHQTVC
ncbi:hypothetical protein L210DRAFT_3523805 [Boletus edulis BED1]|uniref:Uncharacterized protein n=1 Tax=Boletus edulis BED1 TaxID=1328754 RepID=A0AAD4C6D2_BOLED|nr:hypothetical protein L210DRAFT_3523805 [Boletus edulis BED1]